MNFPSQIARVLGRRDGVAAIEFAIMAPMLIALLIGTVEIGLAIRAAIETQEAVSAGALYASQKGFDSPGIIGAVQAATAHANLTASPAPSEFCGCPSATGISSTTCSSLCTDGRTARQYVVIHAALPRPSVIGSYVGLPATLMAQATVRVP